MNTTPQRHDDYDEAEPAIRCEADKYGAAVFEFPQYKNANGRPMRVLAYSKTTAEQTAREKQHEDRFLY